MSSRTGGGLEGGRSGHTASANSAATSRFHVSLAPSEAKPRDLNTLGKNAYEDTRPRLPCFTHHSELFRSPRRPAHTEVVTWSLSLRPQTPTYMASREKSPTRWNHHFQNRDHSFDMLKERQRAAKEMETNRANEVRAASKRTSEPPMSAREPRMRVDPQRGGKHTDEPFVDAVYKKTNTESYRFLVRNGERSDVIQTMLSLRPAG
eukprot:TRINITY_DN46856_c0_g1_i1.p1 TRINITY_DN46856_c0_g1~~TRINITY_DN46856_c0_g1_i1.p1  ORF type:complete len:235 (+),score=33.32 TRINITY_DN46856_c0_g1_i1:90-707(+)